MATEQKVFKRAVRLISRRGGLIEKVREFEFPVRTDGRLGKESTDLLLQAWEDQMDGLEVIIKFGWRDEKLNWYIEPV